MKAHLILVSLGLLLAGCSTDDIDPLENRQENTLTRFIMGKEIAESNVIACAGSTSDGSRVRVYLYPRPGATDIRYFETPNVIVDSNNFDNYTELRPPRQGLFNEFLQFFEVAPNNEKWVIITFEEKGVVNISNPIRLKHLSQATEHLPENVNVSNEMQALNPEFIWVDGTFDDTVIYFQVVATPQNDLLSGTYTLDRNFQFYVLNNVVLNITEVEPPNLELGVDYTFTLLSVTEDNWVNLFSEISFRLE